MTNTTLESVFTREFDIRFIDARSIINEAKISLGVVGYCTKEEEQRIYHEARRMFLSRSNGDKQTMRRLSASLDAIKDSSSGVFSLSGDSSGHGSEDVLTIGTLSTNSTPKISKRRKSTGFGSIKWHT